MSRQHWNNVATNRSRYKNERAGSQRPERGKIFSGIADMSDEEFRARCDMTREQPEDIANRLRGGSGVLHGAFPDKATRKDMAPYG